MGASTAVAAPSLGFHDAPILGLVDLALVLPPLVILPLPGSVLLQDPAPDTGGSRHPVH